MKKLIVIFLLAPVVAMAQYGGNSSGNSSSGTANSAAPIENAPSNEASRIKKKAPAKPAETAVPDAAVEKFTPETIEAPPAANKCKRPDLGVTISTKAAGDVFNARNAEYRNCVQDYVNAQKVAGDQHSAAANTTVQEFNAFSTELNEKFGKEKK